MAWDYYRDLTTSIGDYHANVPSSLWSAIETKLDAGTYNGSGFVSGISLYNQTVCNYPFQLVQVNEEKNCTMGSGSLKLANYYNYAGDCKAQYTLSNSTVMGFSGGGNANNASSIIFAYNDATHQACLVRLMTKYYSSPVNEIAYQIADNAQSHRETLYANLQGAIPVLYNWHSFASISGNGLTIPLVKLASDAINDGDPVSDATTSAFDVLPSSDNNVRSLVNLTLETTSTDNAVTITYNIPALKDNSYSSVKVYGKIGEAPKCDETDDIVEDIDPTINEISLENLEFETEYFFCIQSITNNGLKLSSNVESCKTEDRITPREYRDAVTILTHMYAPGMDDTEFYDVTASGMSWNDSIKATCSYYHNSQTLSNFYGWDTGLCYSSSALNINIDFVSASSTNYKVTITNCSNVKAWINTWSYDVDKTRSVCERVDIANGYARCNPVSNSWTGAGNYISDYNNKTLSEIFTKLVNQFRNCNVYVNGIQWGQQGIGYL